MKKIIALLLLLILALLCSCAPKAPEATAEPTAAPDPTAPPVPTAQPSSEPTPTASPESTPQEQRYVNKWAEISIPLEGYSLYSQEEIDAMGSEEYIRCELFAQHEQTNAVITVLYEDLNQRPEVAQESAMEYAEGLKEELVAKGWDAEDVFEAFMQENWYAALITAREIEDGVLVQAYFLRRIDDTMVQIVVGGLGEEGISDAIDDAMGV